MDSREALIDAFVRVHLALHEPSLTENEKMVLEMVHLHSISVEDAAKTLLMKHKEIRAYLASALEKCCQPPKRQVAQAAE